MATNNEATKRLVEEGCRFAKNPRWERDRRESKLGTRWDERGGEEKVGASIAIVPSKIDVKRLEVRALSLHGDNGDSSSPCTRRNKSLPRSRPDAAP
jgi:hypothetical protein